MQKYVINDVAIRHLVDIRILPLSDEEKQKVLQTPDVWMNLLTEEIDIQKILLKASTAEFTKDQPIRGTPISAKSPDQKDGDVIIHLSDAIDRLKKI